MVAQPSKINLDQGGVDPCDLEGVAKRLSMRFSASPAHDILDHAINDAFKGRIAVVSSFGAESAPLLHLVSKVDPSVPVIFLDTDKHFAQTLSYRKKVAREFGLTNIIDVTPDAEGLATRDPGGDLWRRDADACCALRKVSPLKNVLSDYDAWITGRKQFHGGERMALPAFEANATHIKVNPLIRWQAEDVASYTAKHALPAHPLVAQGYRSIGCWPCTQPVAEGEDVRAGRWRGSKKTECGIHAA